MDVGIFWNPGERRLRAFWRLVAQGALMVALGLLPIVGIAEPLTWLHRRGQFLPGYEHDAYDRVVNMIVGPFLGAAVIASVAIAGRFFDRRPLQEFGVRIDRAWWRGLALGLGLGALLMAGVFSLEWALGWLEPVGLLASNVETVSLGLAFSFTAVKVLCVGTYEEFVSRGYHLRNLSDALGKAWGLMLSSAVFALLHLANENAEALSMLGLFVNALLFAAALLLTERLSTAIGLHIAWNFFEGAVFGFPVSGDKEGASLVGIAQRGPALWTGGAFGPEAGLVGILASVSGIGLLWLWQRRAGARNGCASP